MRPEPVEGGALSLSKGRASTGSAHMSSPAGYHSASWRNQRRPVDFSVEYAARQDWNIDSRPWAGGSMRRTSPPYAIGPGSKK
jgi:hypothetical protein